MPFKNAEQKMYLSYTCIFEGNFFAKAYFFSWKDLQSVHWSRFGLIS